jgi:hypothetical protein
MNEPIGWWECVTDISEFNRENEPAGLRIVMSTGLGFQYFELQQRESAYLIGGLNFQGNWFTMKRMVIEFFVNQGHKDSNGQWVTDSLKVFMVGEPNLMEWKPCAEPDIYAKRVPGTSSMIVESV